MTAIVSRGNALGLHLPDASVDLVVTSPPYFGLRSYQDGGEHYDGQVGDEATPTEYLDALIAATAEWMRVLKPGGSIFVNLGDKYNSAASNQQSGATLLATRGAPRAAGQVEATGGRAGSVRGMAPKTLIGLPWRYAIRCIDELGLILRAEIVWAKPNGLPESVTDRVRRSHEQVFHFVKQPRYYSAVDEVRESYLLTGTATPNRSQLRNANRNDTGSDLRTNGWTAADANPLGKLPGSVWSIPTAPLKVPDHLGIDHFAAYPPELVRRIVLGWSPREVCTACGEGRRPVVHRATTGVDNKRSVGVGGMDDRWRDRAGARQEWGRIKAADPDRIAGYMCACGEFSESFPKPESTPGLVLDPFGGTGTTALVASAYGRVGISVDLSADYCRLAKWRTADPGERARVLGVDKPPVQVNGQLGLFEGGAA